ncbi:hypothetical protein [Puia dinghuensis]|uniref:Uncharacterized protein n=1 Tax=Puia dinghuensis TaxID=1792502 RepID=A0A8J2U6G4_9BACT|nr:hypothetical protein [Puia dinghuensis]GGA82137.1 hypothetical protein GCM10011511_01380 [Puia dinghuensis]
MKESKYYIDIEVDRLTNSITNTISGDSFPTEVLPVTKADLKSVTKKAGWKFDWKSEAKLTDRATYKLTIEGNPNIIQGLISISDYGDHFFMHLIESAPFNFGKPKLYEGVPGNLVAFACKESLEKGYEGFLSFFSKTRLIAHYEKTLQAVHVGGHRMVIYADAAAKLINRYFKN